MRWFTKTQRAKVTRAAHRIAFTWAGGIIRTLCLTRAARATMMGFASLDATTTMPPTPKS
jgi:hypothetical protein